MRDSRQLNRRDRNDWPSNRNRWHPYPTNNNSSRWPSRNQEDRDNQADDQIAPNHVSGSVDHLQRWALATANLPQHGHGKRENEIIERIQRRYANASPGGYENPHTEENHELDNRHPARAQPSDPIHTAAKRRQSTSPSREEQSKKRRLESPSHQTRLHEETAEKTEEGDTDAQSSEWSFPESGNED